MITSLSELDLTEEQKVQVLEWLAYKVWRIREEVKEEPNFYHKSHDPLEVNLEEKVADSYCLNLHSHFNSLEEVEEEILTSTISYIHENRI